jgi:hypothetical protein
MMTPLGMYYLTSKLNTINKGEALVKMFQVFRGLLVDEVGGIKLMTARKGLFDTQVRRY